MFTFVALVLAIIALVMAKRAQNDLRTLRSVVAEMQVKAASAARASAAPEEPRPTAAAAPPAPREPEPVIPIYTPRAPEPVIPIYTPAEPAAASTSVGEPPIEVPPLAAPEPPIAPPPPPAAPPSPPFWKQIDWEGLVGVKLFSWIAGVALVVAAIYFLKYSVEHGWISPPVRATIGLLTGAALLVVCELRVARGYKFTANAMHGAGIAILYATLFAMHALWHLLPATAVFAGMIVVTAIAVTLSVRRDSLFIALLGLMGGFATPALLSTGENRPIALFSYLLLLNVGLAWIAYRKRWPALTICSALLSVIYQWAWIARFLSASQLPLAVGIFAVFAIAAGAALWMGRREDSKQKLFDRAGQVAVAMPVLFALFSAAVPAYGVRYNVLFGFLILMAAGLAIIAWLRDAEWLHAIGMIGTVLTFALWLAVSYTPAAWPTVLAWVSAFVILYLAIGMRYRSRLVIGAAALLFVFSGLVIVEPGAASAALLFPVLLGLMTLIAAYALRYEDSAIYCVGAFFVVVTQAFWAVRHLDSIHVDAGLIVYAAAGLLFVVVPVLARRFGRSLHPAVLYFVLIQHVFLLFVAPMRALTTPPWPFLAVLLLLDLAAAAAALYLRRGSLVVGSALLTQLVLLAWTSITDAAPTANIALACALGVAAYALLTWALARRAGEALPFAYAALGALLLGHVVALGAGASSDVPLFGTLLATHALLAIATLFVATVIERPIWAIAGVILTTFGTALAFTTTPGRQLLFAAVLYAIFIAYPLVLGARVRRSIEPYLAAVLASVSFFFFARDAMENAGYGHVIGVLPVSQCLILLLLVVQLVRMETPGERELTRLAMVSGAALAFLTAAVPLQLEKEWITLAWALEGAALVWLFRRIPHSGLLVWAAALLAAVFSRLVFNPAVFNYHPSSTHAIVNWYLYTYLLCAVAFFVAAQLAPREYVRAVGVTRGAGTFILFLLLNIEIADYYSTGPTLTFNFLSSSLAQDLTYTFGWALFAIAVLVAGIAFRTRAARVAAIALLAVTVFKCFLHDLARLGGLYRIASFLGLAVALVMVSVLLQKFVLSRRVPAPPSEPSAAQP